MKNVAVVGIGNIGSVHCSVILNSEQVNLYAICDIDNEKLSNTKYDDVKKYEDYHTLLSDSNIDAVHICTPHYLHYKMISDCLDAGKTVVSEKPLVMKKEEFNALLARDDKDKICAVA